MSTKAVVSVVVVLAVVAGGWYFWSMQSSTSNLESLPSGTEQSATQAQGTAQTQGTNMQASVGASDSSLDKEAAAIDAQLKAASTDSSAAGSFSDVPVAQTE